jgi:26S proteasome regulatory subunit N5
MEVIQWTSLWNTYKDEFENEKSMLGGTLGDKAAEDLRQRIIEHVSFALTAKTVRCLQFHLI